MKKACILWELCKYLVKFLRRQIYTSSGNICELFCSLTNHVVGCYLTYGYMCTCSVRSRLVECELLLPIFHGSGEIYCSLPYVEIGLFPLGWLRNASAPTEGCHHLPWNQLFNVTDRDGIFAGSSEIREGKYPSVHLILSREPSWSSFSSCCGFSFLVWSKFLTCVPNQQSNGITHVSFNSLSWNNLLEVLLVQIEALLALIGF